MPRLTVALAQINPTLGNLTGNSALICDRAAEAVAAGAGLVVFPEMALTGYPVADLALRPSFQTAARAALDDLAASLADRGLAEVPVLVGCLGIDPAGGRPQNALALLRAGVVTATYAKHHLPTYGVFDESRYFAPGADLLVLEVGGAVVAAVICEDLWQDGGPVDSVRAAGADLLVAVNGSPYEKGKGQRRLELVRRRARQCGCPVAYVNLVGGQDELVFDGASFVVDADGVVLATGKRFTPDLLFFGLGADEATPAAAPVEPAPDSAQPAPDSAGDVYAALMTGLRDYAAKNGMPSVALGLSGGIDSALTATLACDALGPAAVHGVAMPSRHSSAHSLTDAAELARRTGLHHAEISIAPMVDAFLDSLTLDGVAWENLQARVRGMILMSLANQHGHLVLATGNKSELAVGYSTLYGDAVGGYAPLKDVFKTDVWSLSRWRNTEEGRAAVVALGQPAAVARPIPENSLTKPPSAELRPGQYDTDSLPDYAQLDAILCRYIELDRSGADIVAEGFPSAVVERVLRLVDAAEFKRRQYPPGPKVTVRNFGADRRMPITSRWREVVPS